MRQFWFIFLVGLMPVLASATDVEVKVFNVGQGNCQVVKVQKPGQDSEYLLYDAGTESFQKESLYQQVQSDLTTPPASPLQERTNLTSPSYPSNITPVVKRSKDLRVEPIARDEIVSGIVSYLQRGERTASLRCQTAVISHPDQDHYNLLMSIFAQPEDHIENLIFAGLPSRYYSNNQSVFANWLQTRIAKGTKVYFPAVQKGPVTKLKEALEKEKREAFQPFMGGPDFDWKTVFRDAFDFGEDVSMTPLAVNPTHDADGFRYSEAGWDNADSLVLRVQHGQESIVFTGDATDVTMRKIFHINRGRESQLQTTYFMAAHHGAACGQTNTPDWMQRIFLPGGVLMSHGHNHLHPHPDAYNSFQKSPRLKTTEKHKVYVGPVKPSEQNRGRLRCTQSAILSTLTQGNLTVLLDQGTVKSELNGITTQFKLVEKDSRPPLADVSNNQVLGLKRKNNNPSEQEIKKNKSTPPPITDT